MELREGRSQRQGKGPERRGLNRLIEAAPSPRYRGPWTLPRHTAVRIGEALALRWADINGKVTFRRSTTKTKTTRQSVILTALRDALDAYRMAWEAEHGHSPLKEEALFPCRDSTMTLETTPAA